MDCTVEQKKLVPLSKVVNASLVDMYEDQGRYEQRANFMTVRGLKKLYVEVLPKLKHKVWLTVHANTHTATLPLDFESETFVGFVDSRWHKVPMKLNNRLTDAKNIVDVPCEDKCPKCNQDTSICNEMAVTEETVQVIVNNLPYDQTIVKKLYPNGDYYLETTTPVFDLETSDVINHTTKEFIVNFSLNPCGCLASTTLNTTNLQTHCPDIYCNHYAPCDTACNTSYGGYKIFEESGLIQLDVNYPFEKVYLEYWGFIIKIRGEYMVPMVSFETLVEYTKWKLIANKKNVPRWERLDQFENFRRERRNMEKVLGRFSLGQIIQAVSMIPKFDVDYGTDWYSSFCMPAEAAAIVDACTSGAGGTGSGSGSGNTIINNNTFISQTGGFVIAVKVDGTTGHPVAGESTYQNNLLIGAVDVQYILLAKQVLTIEDGDFTFDTVTGTVDISPSVFIVNDSLIINYNKVTPTA